MKYPQTGRKVILITGTSSGIGKVCAEYLWEKGFIVYGLSRKESLISKFHWIKTDVSIEEEVKFAIQEIMNAEGQIDVLINNAGISTVGAIEETTSEGARQQFDINFFGALNMIRHVLPNMRKQKQGLIINISSVAGVMGLPFQGLYSASKFALEGLTESLRMEISGSGVKATLIEPGDFCTPVTQHRIFNLAPIINSYYEKLFSSVIRVVEEDERNGPEPLMLAKLVLKIINKRNPGVRYTVGKLFQRLSVFLKRILPSFLFELILKNYYKI